MPPGSRYTDCKPAFRRAAVAALLLATACVGGAQPTHTPAASPSEASTPADLPPATAEAPSETALRFAAPTSEAALPLDLVALDSDNLEQLQPFRQLTADGLSGPIDRATLAYPASYQFELAALLDDGELILWNMATGEVRYRDQQADGALPFDRNPPLAISTEFQGYVATPAILRGIGQEHVILVRTPDAADDPLPYSGAGEAFSPEAVNSLAFSADGRRLAAGLSGDGSGLAKLWNLWDSDELSGPREFPTSDPVSAVALTPSGNGLLVAAGDALLEYDLVSNTQRLHRTFEFEIRGLELGPEGESLVVWSNRAATIESPVGTEPIVVPAAAVIRQADISPSGQLLLLVDGPLLRLWDLPAGREVARFSDGSTFLDAAFFDDGRLLATIDDQARVLLWGVRRGAQLPQDSARISTANVAELERAARLYVPQGFQVEFSPTSDWLAIGARHRIYLLDLPTLALQRELARQADSFTPFHVSAGGTHLAWLAEPAVVRVWDLTADRAAHEIAVPDEHCCTQVLLTPNADYLITVAGQVARRWSLASGQQLNVWEGVQRVHGSPDGSRLAFEMIIELAVVIWDLDTDRELRTLTGFTTAAPFYTTNFSPTWDTMYWVARTGMLFSDVSTGGFWEGPLMSWGVYAPDGSRLAAVEDGWALDSVGEAHLIDPHSGATLAVLDHGEEAIIDALAFSPDGQLVASASELSARLWEAPSGAQLWALAYDDEVVNGLRFSPDGRVLLARLEGDLLDLWVVPGAGNSAGAEPISAASARRITLIDSLQLEAPATDAVFAPEPDSVAVATGTGQIWYWNLATGAVSQGASQHRDWIYRLAAHPAGGNLISVSKDGQLRLQQGPQSSGAGASGQAGELSALALLPDQELAVTSGQDGALRFWRLPELRPLHTIQAHSDWVWDLAIAPAGNRLASAAANGSIRLWQLRVSSDGSPSVNLLRQLEGHTAAVWGLAFSPDGRRLASAAWDQTVRVWDTASGDQRMLVDGHSDWVYDVAYSPDGTLLASASADGTVRLWSAVTGEPLATLFADDGPVRSVAFSSDGGYLVSATENGAVQLWGVTQ